jgi:drug/metabolite transporter (DMT)-like permease
LLLSRSVNSGWRLDLWSLLRRFHHVELAKLNGGPYDVDRSGGFLAAPDHQSPNIAAVRPAGLPHGTTLNTPSSRPYLWMLVGQISFAFMATLAHALKDYCGWQVIAVCRSTIPMVIIAGIAAVAGVRLVILGSRALWIRSISGSISLVCTFYAFTRLPISDVLTITNLFPVWIALLSWPFLGMRPTFTTWIAIVSGVAGVALIQQPHLAEGNLASFAALTSSFCSAVAMLGLHQLHHMDTRAIVFHFSSVSLLFSLSAMFLLGDGAPPPSTLQAVTIAMLLGVGVTATLGQICLTKAFTLGDPAKVAVVGLSQVGFGVVIEILLWGRQFSRETVLGMIMILAPTGWLMLRGGASAEPFEE